MNVRRTTATTLRHTRTYSLTFAYTSCQPPEPTLSHPWLTPKGFGLLLRKVHFSDSQKPPTNPTAFSHPDTAWHSLIFCPNTIFPKSSLCRSVLCLFISHGGVWERVCLLHFAGRYTVGLQRDPSASASQTQKPKTGVVTCPSHSLETQKQNGNLISC